MIDQAWKQNSMKLHVSYTEVINPRSSLITKRWCYTTSFSRLQSYSFHSVSIFQLQTFPEQASPSPQLSNQNDVATSTVHHIRFVHGSSWALNKRTSANTLLSSNMPIFFPRQPKRPLPKTKSTVLIYRA